MSWDAPHIRGNWSVPEIKHKRDDTDTKQKTCPFCLQNRRNDKGRNTCIFKQMVNL